MALSIDTTGMAPFIDSFVPATMFVVPNEAWDVDMPSSQVETIIQNMLFPGMFYYETMVEMGGQTITSSNGTDWLITVVNNEFVFLSDGEGGSNNITLLKGQGTTNILANSGVIHFVNDLVSIPNQDDPVAPSSAPSAAIAKCVVCEGPVKVDAFIHGSVACTDWVSAARTLEPDSEECLLERLAGVMFCDCPASGDSVCNMCEGSLVDVSRSDQLRFPTLGDTYIPDMNNTTCSDISLVPAVDGQATVCITNFFTLFF